MLRAYSILEGYRDLPCRRRTAGGLRDPAAVSRTPPAMTDAVALRINRLDIPIDRVGSHELPLGEARLPNGLLSEATFALIDDWPPGVTIIEGGVRSSWSRSTRARWVGRSTNLYEHGWRSGTERVAAFLVFDVTHFDPGATLSIRDVVVR